MRACEMESGSGVIVGMSEDMCAFRMRTLMSHSDLHFGRHTTRVCRIMIKHDAESENPDHQVSIYALSLLPGHHALPVPLL